MVTCAQVMHPTSLLAKNAQVNALTRPAARVNALPQSVVRVAQAPVEECGRRARWLRSTRLDTEILLSPHIIVGGHRDLKQLISSCRADAVARVDEEGNYNKATPKHPCSESRTVDRRSRDLNGNRSQHD